MYGHRSGWVFDDGPEIARQIIEHQCADLVKIKHETNMIVFLLHRTGEPFRYCTGLAGRNEAAHEVHLGCECSRKRLDRANHGKSTVAATERFPGPWKAIDGDDMFERRWRADPRRFKRNLAAEAVTNDSTQRKLRPFRQMNNVACSGRN